MLRDVVPSDWDGKYQIIVGGKSGELLFFSGVLPAIRRALPKARISISLHPHYVGIVPGLEHQPDEVLMEEFWTKPYPQAPLASQVTHGLKCAVAAVGQRSMKTLTLLDDRNLVTCIYLRHRGSKPFYELFMDSCGVGGEKYTPPWWGSERGVGHNAVILASANIHAGSGVRVMPLMTREWLALAEQARAAHMHPIATGHKDDPRPDMPGWQWVDTNEPEEVFGLLRAASRVVGFNSGMTFAATRLVSPIVGRVTMIDSQGQSQYLFEKMHAVLNGAHRQIPLHEAQRRGFYNVIKEALE